MAKQQHQNPVQGTSSTNQRRNEGSSQGEPADDTMDIGHRASHVSSTDPMYGTHSSLGGADERGDADQPPEGSAADAPAQEASQHRAKQPTRGGAQGGLTGSVGQLDPGKSNPPKREHAQADDTQDESARVQPGEAQGQSKYSPTANEQDKLSRAQGGASLKDTRPEATAEQNQRSDQRAARPLPRNPREGGPGTAGDDSPTVRSPTQRDGKLTATHDIDLAGPDNSGTLRDK